MGRSASRVCGAPDVDVDGIRAGEGKILILAKFNSSLKAKLPSRQEALVVFSVIVLSSLAGRFTAYFGGCRAG